VTGITILGVILASGIVWLLAPGFHDDPSKLGMTTLLTQIMFPYLIFISLAALAMGVLNSMRAFAAPAFSPVFFNIFIIGCAYFLSPMMAEPIHGVAMGWWREARHNLPCSCPVCVGAECDSGFDSHRVIQACGGSAR
jgi:putative peptidoglycan lipid II flippase